MYITRNIDVLQNLLYPLMELLCNFSQLVALRGLAPSLRALPSYEAHPLHQTFSPCTSQLYGTTIFSQLRWLHSSKDPAASCQCN